MFKPFWGLCSCHNKNRLIINKNMLCKQGNDERKGKNSTLQNSKKIKHDKPKVKQKVQRSKKILVRKKTRTGEAEAFRAILEERGPYSQISGQYLGEGFNPWWFSHIVPKSIAPGLRLDPRNIILKTPNEHTLWENHKHKIRDDPKWKWVFELAEQLKQEYNNQ